MIAMAAKDGGAGSLHVAREEDVDVCALNDNAYLIQAGHGRFAEIYSLQADLSEYGVLRSLHERCRNGDHYMARTYIMPSIIANLVISSPVYNISDGAAGGRFYIIKKSSCTEVSDLESALECTTYKLHPKCQGGSFYLASRSGFFIIHSEDNTFCHTENLRSPPTAPEILHEDFWDGLYYYANDNFFYVVKMDDDLGLVYHRRTSLRSAVRENEYIVPISGSVAAFLKKQGMSH